MAKSYALKRGDYFATYSDGHFVPVSDASRAQRFDSLTDLTEFVRTHGKQSCVFCSPIRPVRIIETPGKETRRIVPVEGAPFVTFARPEGGPGGGAYHGEWGEWKSLDGAKLYESQRDAFNSLVKGMIARGYQYLVSDADTLVGVAVTPAEPTITVEEIE